MVNDWIISKILEKEKEENTGFPLTIEAPESILDEILPNAQNEEIDRGVIIINYG